MFAGLGTNMTFCVGEMLGCVFVCCSGVFMVPSFYHFMLKCFVHSMFSSDVSTSWGISIISACYLIKRSKVISSLP